MYFPKNGQWVFADLVAGVVGRPETCEMRATRQFYYVIAIEHTSVKDVTARSALRIVDPLLFFVDYFSYVGTPNSSCQAPTKAEWLKIGGKVLSVHTSDMLW